MASLNNSNNGNHGGYNYRGHQHDRSSTIWVGDIEPGQNDKFFHDAFELMGEQLKYVKIIRNRDNNQPVGYGFLGFNDEETAQRILQTYNNTPIPNSAEGKNWRLNTAGRPDRHRLSYTPGYNRHSPNDPRPQEFTLFVGELTPDVEDSHLLNAFKARYSSTLSAKVIYQPSGQSKGFGFVRMGDHSEQQRALAECIRDPPLLGQQPIRVSEAQPRPAPRYYDRFRNQPSYEQDDSQQAGQYAANAHGDEFQMSYFAPLSEVPQVPGYPAVNYQTQAYQYYGSYGGWPNQFNGQMYPVPAQDPAFVEYAAQANQIQNNHRNLSPNHQVMRDHGFDPAGHDLDGLNQDSISRSNDLFHSVHGGRFG